MDIPSKDIRCTENAIWVEHHVQRIIAAQERKGILFNKAKALRLIKVLIRRQERLYEKIRPTLSLEIIKPYPKPISKPFRVDGTYTESCRKWWDSEGDVYTVGGPFTRILFAEPDLGRRAKLMEQLLRLGWVPASYTEKGNPQLTVDGEPCPSLERISGQIGQWIARWYTYRHRQSQIEGWIDKLRPDSRLSAGAIPIGTPTYRMRHRVVVNVPRASSVFGWHMRSLFIVPKGKKMVGFDASGLELRMLADAIDDEDYTREVTTGDIHTKHQKDAGLSDRDNAKTFIYAFIYGAGDSKIGSIVGGSEYAGRRIRSQFLAANPKLRECIEHTRQAAGRGYLVGSDGRHIHLRRDSITGRVQDHKALNTRLQSAGAIVMKWAMVILDFWIRESRMQDRADKVLDMHDEAQWEVEEELAHTVGMMGTQAIVTAGVMLNLNVPLAADYKIGSNWAMTH